MSPTRLGPLGVGIRPYWLPDERVAQSILCPKVYTPCRVCVMRGVGWWVCWWRPLPLGLRSRYGGCGVWRGGVRGSCVVAPPALVAECGVGDGVRGL